MTVGENNTVTKSVLSNDEKLIADSQVVINVLVGE